MGVGVFLEPFRDPTSIPYVPYTTYGKDQFAEGDFQEILPTCRNQQKFTLRREVEELTFLSTTIRFLL